MSAYLKNGRNVMDDRSGRYRKGRCQNREGSHCFRYQENMQGTEDKTRTVPPSGRKHGPGKRNKETPLRKRVKRSKRIEQEWREPYQEQQEIPHKK